MLVTLVAVLCNGPLCLEKIVTTSEQSGITMTACQVNAQIGIAEWLAFAGPNSEARRANALRILVGLEHLNRHSGLTRHRARIRATRWRAPE